MKYEKEMGKIWSVYIFGLVRHFLDMQTPCELTCQPLALQRTEVRHLYVNINPGFCSQKGKTCYQLHLRTNNGIWSRKDRMKSKMLLMPRKRRVVESREREKVTKAYMKQIIYSKGLIETKFLSHNALRARHR